MIVDDEEVNVAITKQYLRREGYSQFVTTCDSREVYQLAKQQSPDLLLLDIRMPHIDGLELLRQFSADDVLQQIPILILTAVAEPDIKAKALKLGANDFLTKPVDPNELAPRVRNSLVFKAHINHLASGQQRLADVVQRQFDELIQTRQQLILSLARAAEHRDNETANHVIRVGAFAGCIAKELGWNADLVDMLEQAARLHDVGKIGVPDAVLFKPGALDPEEYAIIKEHCKVGHEIICPLSGDDKFAMRAHARYGQNILNVRTSPLLMMAARIAQTHHEKWDGSGYPLGLRGEAIPIEGRITAVADVFDALSSERPYKKAMPPEKCFEILREGRGKHFAPGVLDAFFSRVDEILEIQERFRDG